LRARIERFRISLAPPFVQVAIGIEFAALIIVTVGDFVPDDHADGA